MRRKKSLVSFGRYSLLKGRGPTCAQVDMKDLIYANTPGLAAPAQFSRAPGRTDCLMLRT